jgi:hypothetical protein
MKANKSLRVSLETLCVRESLKIINQIMMTEDSRREIKILNLEVVADSQEVALEVVLQDHKIMMEVTGIKQLPPLKVEDQKERTQTGDQLPTIFYKTNIRCICMY